MKSLAVATLMGSFVLSSFVRAEALDSTESEFANFDSKMLMGASSGLLDVERYSRGSPVETGTYSVDLSINGTPAGRFDIAFIPGETPHQAKPELSLELLDQLGVDTDKLQASAGTDATSQDLFSRVANATYRYDSADQRLELSVPQVAMLNRPRGYVSPQRWDRGVNAAFVNYSANAYRSSSQNSQGSTAYANFHAGLNLGIWRLRQRSALNWNNETGKAYQAVTSYAQRDIDSLGSELTVGDVFSDGEMYDSVATRGVQLATDDRMLPDSLRGYAPVVRGVAATNAQVTVRQNGFIIQQTSVAPGAFEITDLNPASQSGDLEVTVTEADGQEKQFIVPFSSVSRSLREGASRYTATVGQARNLSYGSTPTVAQVTYQRGLSNLVTGYVGMSASEGYGAAVLGGVLNSEYGAIGADITASKTELASKAFAGQSARVTYNKVLQNTGTNFTLAAYRYSTEGYFGVRDALNARDQLQQKGGNHTNAFRHARSRAQLNVSQRINDRSRLYLNASVQNYWNSPDSDKQFQSGYSQTFNWGSAGVSASRTKDMYGGSSTQYMVNFSMPLGAAGSPNRAHLSTSATSNSDGSADLQSTLSGTRGEDQTLGYGISASMNRPGSGKNSRTTGANAQLRTSAADLSASLSKGSDFQQISLGGSGSVVVHPAGITFGQPLGDTIAIVHAPDAAGATLDNATGVKLDRNGQAVVSYLTPYRVNTLGIDPKGLSDDVELQSTSQEVVPRSGSVVMARFKTVTGRALLINARQTDGKPLPFGANVYDSDGRTVGVVGQGGQIFARLGSDQGRLWVSPHGKESSRCSMTYHLKPREKEHANAELARIDLPCRG
ncbi:fimbrial biogenesis outer membrane usher protein [Pseudomonas sp. PDM32]|uniref:fimbria/pilus outer membrane usher protein n=1 Tax=Pseudomonas sp. PDM32 TaxID=2854768 RepID=UPI001C45701B|nr:fimbria/pilus outer membrane usher protein [Pseudomonas sp. PDM32]MBV7576694.1 fimbrial biogenesis outer membrane usher protein [Pseudomonas sp. PDM32]